MYLILFILFCVLGLITYFTFFRNKGLVCLVLFLFLVFLDVICVIYFLSYITGPLFVYSGLDFIFLIVLSFLQSCLVIFYFFIGNYFYPTFVEKDSVSLDKVVVGLDRVYLEEEDLDESFGKRFVIRYSGIPIKVLKRTKSFVSGTGTINFFYGGKSCFKDFFISLMCIFDNYLNSDIKADLVLYDYSLILHKDLSRFKEGFMGYEDFVQVFMLYVKKIFYDCFVNNGIHFSKASFNFDFNFWLDNLDSKGKFLKSFVKGIRKSSHIYSKSSFDFLLEEYDFNKPSHLSSKLVPYSVLSSDFKRLHKDSLSYKREVNRFIKNNYTSLESVSSFKPLAFNFIRKRSGHHPEYKVFLKYCHKWF